MRCAGAVCLRVLRLWVRGQGEVAILQKKVQELERQLACGGGVEGGGGALPLQEAIQDVVGELTREGKPEGEKVKYHSDVHGTFEVLSVRAVCPWSACSL